MSALDRIMPLDPFGINRRRERQAELTRIGNERRAARAEREGEMIAWAWTLEGLMRSDVILGRASQERFESWFNGGVPVTSGVDAREAYLNWVRFTSPPEVTMTSPATC